MISVSALDMQFVIFCVILYLYYYIIQNIFSVLYKEGPPFYHASYIVVVEVVDADSLIVDSSMSARSMTWNSLFGLERLSETIAKVNVRIYIYYKYNTVILMSVYFYAYCQIRVFNFHFIYLMFPFICSTF